VTATPTSGSGLDPSQLEEDASYTFAQIITECATPTTDDGSAEGGGVAVTIEVIEDQIPSGLTFISASDGGTLVNGNTVRWVLDAVLDPGASLTVSYTASLNASGDTTNSACVDAGDNNGNETSDCDEAPVTRQTPTPLPSDTPTQTSTPVPGATATNTPVASATATNTLVPTETDTPVPGATATDTATPGGSGPPAAAGTATPVLTPGTVATSTSTAEAGAPAAATATPAPTPGPAGPSPPGARPTLTTTEQQVLVDVVRVLREVLVQRGIAPAPAQAPSQLPPDQSADGTGT
jgi:hypothetical protein